MLFQAAQTLYSGQQLWTADTAHLFCYETLGSPYHLQLVLTIIDCMISVSLHQVHCCTLLRVNYCAVNLCYHNFNEFLIVICYILFIITYVYDVTYVYM